MADRVAGPDGGPLTVDATVLGRAGAELDAWRKRMLAGLSGEELDALGSITEKLAAAEADPTPAGLREER